VESQIIILDAASGDSVGTMSVDGLDLIQNTYPVNMIAVAKDGTIYITNLAEQIYVPGSTFKIYRYDNEEDTPTLILNDILDEARYGDAFAVATDAAGIKYLYASGQGNPNMVVLRDEGGDQAVFDSYVSLPVPGNARHGISPVNAGGSVWVNGADNGYPPPSVITSDGTFIASCPDTILSPGGTSTILYNKFGQYQIISAINAYGGTVSSATVLEDELGTVTFDYRGENYFSSPDDTTALWHKNGWMGNINATGTLSYDSRRHSLITLIGTNSIGSISMDRIFKASTPRDSIYSISVDGVNDYYPTDRVGENNDRTMYMTWDDGKFFAGITGNTLVDPTETNRLYLAFDLDPDGAAGSDIPPEDAGGVNALPISADVVIMVESWTEADYMIGTIYKWNGASWDASEFDGNIAAQGVLAYADEGEDKVAEVAAVRNANGIGNEFTNMAVLAYVAENSSSGEVLSAFPDDNPTGNAPALTKYFYIDSLGSGMFPVDPDHVQIRESISSINKAPGGIINDFTLQPNYPNPFNPETTIRYRLSRSADIQLKVFDITGRLVQNLIEKNQKQGNYDVKFDGSDLSSGIYFYQLQADNKIIATRKMVLIK
jgi:hypothetical protein